jgi:Sodium:dicarboxylate symporter family
VLATSSSETAIPTWMEKLEGLGCSRSLVGLIVPTGYTFNTDGSALYMTLAALFVAQATNTHLTWLQQMSIFSVAGHVKGGERCTGSVVHCAGGNVKRDSGDSRSRDGDHPRHRPLYEHVPRASEHDRKRGGDSGCRALGEGTRARDIVAKSGIKDFALGGPIS